MCDGIQIIYIQCETGIFCQYFDQLINLGIRISNIFISSFVRG